MSIFKLILSFLERTTISFINYYSINTLLLFIVISIVAVLFLILFIFWYLNFAFAIYIVNTIVYFFTKIIQAAHVIINFFIIMPLAYLYGITAATWVLVFLWVFTIFSFSLLGYLLYVGILVNLNVIQIKMLILVMIIFNAVLYYCWYNNYFFALKLVYLLFFIINPIYLLLVNLVFFFFVKPCKIMYNMTLSDWLIVGYCIIIFFFIVLVVYLIYWLVYICLILLYLYVYSIYYSLLNN